MPTMNRLQEPGALVHLMARGIDGRNLFNDDDDHKEFLIRMDKSLTKTGYKLFAWNLMDNHYHMVVQMNENPLSSLMRPLNSGYARWYNKKYGRHGYVFQDRFKSTLCLDLTYAKELIRYIHLNPVRANLISFEKLSDWKWSSHNSLVGDEKSLNTHSIDRAEILRRFSENDYDALQKYMQFLQIGINESNIRYSGILNEINNKELMGAHKGWPSVIGDPEYVKNAMAKHSVGLYRLHRKTDYTYVITKIASEVCKKYNIEIEDLKRKGRNNIYTWAKSELCYKVHYDEKIPLSVIARYLTICISPVAKLIEYRKMRGSIKNELVST